jgi:HD-GYP domain-containing protein (c-di-GMP phosphodiesterase class II)
MRNNDVQSYTAKLRYTMDTNNTMSDQLCGGAGDFSGIHQKIVVELNGLTKISRAVLNNEPLVILYFPFYIGRLSRTDLISSAKQDLLLPDIQPYSVSRNHLAFEKVDNTIIAVEEGSTCGTLIDGIHTREFGVQKRTKLTMGEHTIAIGGPESPFLFHVVVRAMQPADYLNLGRDIPDRLPQARLLYDKVCSFEQNILSNKSMSPQERGTTATEMVRAILSRPDLLELMRCLASNPVLGTNHLARHSVNVTIFSIVLYTSLEFPQKEIIRLCAASLLHDIGMQGIDQTLLLQNRSLSQSEFDTVKKHTEIGSDILHASDDICESAAILARDHHERVNRRGYPQGLSVLPDTTRYFGFLDAFEAMTHDRPQRLAISPHEAVRALVSRDNDAFDSETRKIFLNTFSFFPVSTVVRLNSGEIAQVISINNGHPFTPKVRVIFSSGGQPVNGGRTIDLKEDTGISIVREVQDRDFVREYATTCSQTMVD